MPPDLRSMLNDAEQALLREVDDLDGLDEDGLIALHDRIRRARNKYSKLHRRNAAAQVASDQSRYRAHAAHARSAVKAELFEDALAKVSRRLAAEAKAAAALLKQERLDAARKGAPVVAAKKATSKASGKSPGRSKAAKSAAKAPSRTPASEKKRASTKAKTQRKQTAKDNRPRG